MRIWKPLFLGMIAALSVDAAQLRLEGDRLWLTAQNESLSEVMAAFVRLGVHVEMDPEADVPVRARYVDEPIEKALASLLHPNGYVLFWDNLPGPLGPMLKLGEIRVFRPGHEASVQPMAPSSRVLAVGRMADGRGPEFVRDEILIGFAPGSSADAIRQFLREIGGTIVDGLPDLGIYLIRFPPGTNIPALVEQLANNPLVAEVEPNFLYRAGKPSPTNTGTEPADARFPAPPRTGVAPVAILDSGLLMLPGLEGFVAGELDALDPTQKPLDTAGHGTQMALVATGAIDPTGLEGVEIGLPILAIRAFDDDGSTSNFGIMRSILYSAEQGARVLNMSWGSETSSAFLQSAVGYAQSKDLLLVASAGNEPLGRPMYPAAYDGVIAVSALGRDGTAWPSSNYGEFVFVAAPGTASFPIGYNGPAGSYAGTSIAGAYVARALGLYTAKHPKATAREASEALRRAVSVPQKPWTPQLGYGVLDAAAMKRLLK